MNLLIFTLIFGVLYCLMLMVSAYMDRGEIG